MPPFSRAGRDNHSGRGCVKHWRRLLAGCCLASYCAAASAQTASAQLGTSAGEPGAAGAWGTSGDSGEAQDPDSGPGIVVTAQKRNERLSDVPLSVTALSGDQLDKLGVAGPADLVSDSS